jgi:hypothetical protein
VHDSQVFTELLTEISAKDVWADIAYWSDPNKLDLHAMGNRNQVHQKGKRNKLLSEKQQQMIKKKSKTGARGNMYLV